MRSNGGVLTRPLEGVPALFIPGNAGSHRQGEITWPGPFQWFDPTHS